MFPRSMNEGLDVIYLNWFYAWILPQLFGLLTIPLYYLNKPVSLLPVWLKGCKKNFNENKKEFKKDLVISVCLIAVLGVLVVLN